MHEEIFRKMTDMTFEQFSKWMQVSNGVLFRQKDEEDRKAMPTETVTPEEFQHMLDKTKKQA